MDTLKKLRLSAWKTLLSYYCGEDKPEQNISLCGDFTFPPSAELIKELQTQFSRSSIEGFENGALFSSYHVSYSTKSKPGHAIYKTTASTYPCFKKYDTVEEYKKSFNKRHLKK